MVLKPAWRFRAHEKKNLGYLFLKSLDYLFHSFKILRKKSTQTNIRIFFSWRKFVYNFLATPFMALIFFSLDLYAFNGLDLRIQMS